jgi:hypothetical protein
MPFEEEDTCLKQHSVSRYSNCVYAYVRVHLCSIFCVGVCMCVHVHDICIIHICSIYTSLVGLFCLYSRSLLPL